MDRFDFQKTLRIAGRLLVLALIGAVVLTINPRAVIAASHGDSAATVAGRAVTPMLMRPTPGEASLDVRVFRSLNRAIVNPVFDVIMPFVTDSRVLRILAAAVWLALIVRGGTRGRWAALFLILLVAASDQFTSAVLKPLTGRLRPCEVLANVHFWYQGGHWVWTPREVVGGFKTSFGFPSSHAANVTASTLFLGLVYRKWVPYVGLLFAGLVSLSRVYTGVHWPSDVLAGNAIGAGLAWLAYLAFKRLVAKRLAVGKLFRR